MAIFHLSIKIVSRSSERCSCRSCLPGRCQIGRKGNRIYARLHEERGVIYSEIFLPANAPQEYQNREILWNEVQKVEKKSDAQLAREIEVALPVELSREEQITLFAELYCRKFHFRWNVCGYGNSRKACGWENSFAPKSHAHILLTTRGFKEDGSWAQRKRKLMRWMKTENGFH